MSDDNVIPFPRRDNAGTVIKNLWVAGAGVTLDVKCDDVVHQFTDPEKRCECGAYAWDA